ncbi:MAG: hypothetical protein WC337_08945, partial [Candidatus Muiribacteriota bacterium]
MKIKNLVIIFLLIALTIFSNQSFIKENLDNYCNLQQEYLETVKQGEYNKILELINEIETLENTIIDEISSSSTAVGQLLEWIDENEENVEKITDLLTALDNFLIYNQKNSTIKNQIDQAFILYKEKISKKTDDRTGSGVVQQTDINNRNPEGDTHSVIDNTCNNAQNSADRESVKNSNPRKTLNRTFNHIQNFQQKHVFYDGHPIGEGLALNDDQIVYETTNEGKPVRYYFNSSNRVTPFYKDLNGNWWAERNSFLKMYDENNEIVIKEKNGTRMYFRYGKISRIVDRNNNTTNYIYDDYGRIQRK